MGTSLTGLTPSTTYDALIKVGDNGPLSATAKVLSDGLGNDSILALSTSAVGIGTTTPQRTLQINVPSAATAAVRISNSATGSGANDGFEVAIDSVGNAYVAQKENLPLVFLTNDTERMRITDAGNVGIGTSSPSAKLTVVGTGEYDGLLIVRSTGSGTPQAVLGVDAVGSGVGYVGTVNNIPLQIRTNDVTRLRVDADGLKFGSDTAAANALDDYEEGTWTPSFSGTTFSGAIGATYTKIGRVVNVQMNFVNQTLSSSSGTAAISGLPFTCNNVTFGMVNFTFCDSLTASVATGYVGVSGTSIQIRTNTGVSDTTFIDGTSNRSMMLSATYFV
jgi:sporulation protein YlmC with PRC-barrel domain